MTAKETHLQYTFIIKDLRDKKLPKGLEPYNWRSLINNALIPRLSFVSAQDKKSVSRAMNLIEFNTFNYKVKFQSGLFNSEICVGLRFLQR